MKIYTKPDPLHGYILFKNEKSSTFYALHYIIWDYYGVREWVFGRWDETDLFEVVSYVETLTKYHDSGINIDDMKLDNSLLISSKKCEGGLYVEPITIVKLGYEFKLKEWIESDHAYLTDKQQQFINVLIHIIDTKKI